MVRTTNLTCQKKALLLSPVKRGHSEIGSAISSRGEAEGQIGKAGRFSGVADGKERPRGVQFAPRWRAKWMKDEWERGYIFHTPAERQTTTAGCAPPSYQHEGVGLLWSRGSKRFWTAAQGLIALPSEHGRGRFFLNKQTNKQTSRQLGRKPKVIPLSSEGAGR